MYCPKCAQEMVSDELRFCSRCGFDLSSVKACFNAVGLTGETGVAPQSLAHTRTRPADTNAGVILMCLGALLTGAVVAIGNTGYIRLLDFGLAGGFLVLTLCFASLLLLSEPLTRLVHKLSSSEESPTRSAPSRRRETCFGATLMYVGTILSACSMAMVRGSLESSAFFITLMTIFVFLLLTSHRLMDGARSLLNEKENTPANATDLRHNAHLLETAQAARTLPPAQGVPVSVLDAQRIQTAEMAQPLSVTERTTSLLKNK
jgi:hypothetical protein